MAWMEAFTKLTTITVVADEDCITDVMPSIACKNVGRKVCLCHAEISTMPYMYEKLGIGTKKLK